MFGRLLTAISGFCCAGVTVPVVGLLPRLPQDGQSCTGSHGHMAATMVCRGTMSARPGSFG